MKSFIAAGRAPVRTGSFQGSRAALRVTVAAILAMGGHALAAPQPPGTAVQGNATFQQLGNSLLVTTTNAAGTNRSVINWSSFSVPAGTLTRFQQPSVDSTSINRVTGGKLSDIQGTLSSNGNLVLVNPAGIALGKNALVDTAGFTASTLEMSDPDALAGRLRFSAGKDNKQLKIEGRIIAHGGDIVLIGTDVQVSGTPAPPGPPAKDDKAAKDDKGPKNDKAPNPVQLPTLQADNGSVIIAAGQQVQITGRGLEGIVMQLAPKGKIEITKDGLIHADAVGLFASQLVHSGAIEARRVVVKDDKVRLDTGDDHDTSGKGSSGNGNSGNGNSGKGSSDSGNSGNGNSGNASPAAGTATGDVASQLAIDGGGSLVITPPGSSVGTTTSGAAGASASTDSALQSTLQAALAAPVTQTVARSGTVLATYLAPAVTPAQSLADDRQQDRYAAAPEKRQDKAQDVAQCTR